MAELVYPPVIAGALTAFRALDLRIHIEGAHHVPRQGGAVLVCNHISYLDFFFAGYGAYTSARRKVRFMAKAEVFSHPIAGPPLRGMKHIPVDRAEGGLDSFRAAIDALRGGEIVGVFPEATISRSFQLKKFKTGAVRMAAEAGVPLLPVAVWGPQRLWTKDHPRHLTRRHTPIGVFIGEPILLTPQDKPVMATRRVRGVVADLLGDAQRRYPEKPSGPDDAWWLPAELGGTAPTVEEAAALDERELALRAERAERAERGKK